MARFPVVPPCLQCPTSLHILIQTCKWKTGMPKQYLFPAVLMPYWLSVEFQVLRTEHVTGWNWKQAEAKTTGKGEEDLLVSGGTDVDAAWVTSWLELACKGDVVPEETIAGHSHTNHAGQHRTWVNAYPHLEKYMRPTSGCLSCATNVNVISTCLQAILPNKE